jgi:hypothetical protein
MSGGMFTRIIYSSDSNSMNGIYLSFDLSGQIGEIYPSKFKIQFAAGMGGPGTSIRPTISDYDNCLIKSLCAIERSILMNIAEVGKTPQYKLRDQLVQNNFKFFWLSNTMEHDKNGTAKNSVVSSPPIKHHPPTHQMARFILKISGVWSTPTSYGITYKFSRVTTTLC